MEFSDRKTNRRSRPAVYVMVAGLLLLQAATLKAEGFGFSDFTRDLTDLSRLAQLDYLPTRMVSTWDRTGGNNDGVQRSWFKNGVYTVADLKGPGVVRRLYSAKPGGRLRIYVDGNPKPVIDMPCDDFFSGQRKPFLQPMVGPMGGGSYSYFPIPYAKELKIQVTPDKPMGKHFDPFAVGVYYQVTYQTFPRGDKVRSLKLPLTPADAAAWAVARKIWEHPGRDPKPSHPHEIELNRRVEIQPGESTRVLHLEGEGVIDRLFLNFWPNDPALLRSTLIQMRWDHDAKEDVNCPIGDFFGNGFSRVPYRSLAMGLTKHGYYSFFAMPYRQGATVRMVNESTRQPITVTLRVAYRKVASLPQNIGYFHAGWRRQHVVGIDLNHENNSTQYNYHILDVHGRGRFIGFNLDVFNHHVVWWGEGDPMIVVDDEKWPPAIHGTGTEEYSNDAWGFHQYTTLKTSGRSPKRRSVIPVSGVLVNGVDTPLKCFGGNAIFSFNIADSVPFRKRILVTIEHGTETDDLSNDYSSTAYWYARPGEEDFFLMPPARQRKEIPIKQWAALRTQAEREHLVHLRVRLAQVAAAIASHPSQGRLSWSRAVLLMDLLDHAQQLGLTAAEQSKLKKEWKHPRQMGITKKPVIDVIYRQLAARLKLNGPTWNEYPPATSQESGGRPGTKSPQEARGAGTR